MIPPDDDCVLIFGPLQYHDTLIDDEHDPFFGMGPNNIVFSDSFHIFGASYHQHLSSHHKFDTILPWVALSFPHSPQQKNQRSWSRRTRKKSCAHRQPHSVDRRHSLSDCSHFWFHPPPWTSIPLDDDVLVLLRSLQFRAVPICLASRLGFPF